MVFYVPEKLSRPFDPDQVYVIACVSYSISPLQPRPNVCYSMFLMKYPAPSTPAQCMSFYVPDIVSRSFDPGTIYVILCSWFSPLLLRPWHYVCFSIFLKKYPTPSTPAQYMLFYSPGLISCCLTAAQCMLFYVLDLVCCPCDPGTVYNILCSWFFLPPLQPGHNVCYSMFLT